jgi:hypothetical protein
MARRKQVSAPDVEKNEQVSAPDVALVLMAKDGTEIEVHPTCVKAHEGAGWKVVEQGA